MTTRNRRSGVEDRWHKADGQQTATYGSGKRWRARYVDENGREVSMLIDATVSSTVPGKDHELRNTTGTQVLASAPTISTHRVQTYARIPDNTPLGGRVRPRSASRLAAVHARVVDSESRWPRYSCHGPLL